MMLSRTKVYHCCKEGKVTPIYSQDEKSTSKPSFDVSHRVKRSDLFLFLVHILNSWLE